MARRTEVITGDVEVDLAALIEGVPLVSELESAGHHIDLERDPEFVAELLQTRFVHDVLTAMARLGWTRGELARRMGKTPQYVSRVLRHESPSNFTIATMAGFACALDFDLRIEIGVQVSRQAPRRGEASRVAEFQPLAPPVTG